MPDIFELIINWLTTFPNYLIIVAVVIGYIIYYFYSHKDKPESDVFQFEDFRESVYISQEKLLKQFGVDIECYLIKGIEPIGKITKFYNYKGKIKFESPSDLEDKKIKTDKEVDLWVLRLGKKSVLDYIFGGANYEYLIIDNEHLNPYDGTRQRWAVKEDVSFVPYGNCFVTSEKGVAYCNDISFKRAQEEILTHTQNFPRKVAYLELKQAKTMERLEAQIEKKSAQYEKYKKDVLASGKDIEEEEEENE